jgi:hypothetical protein
MAVYRLLIARGMAHAGSECTAIYVSLFPNIQLFLQQCVRQDSMQRGAFEQRWAYISVVISTPCSRAHRSMPSPTCHALRRMAVARTNFSHGTCANIPPQRRGDLGYCDLLLCSCKEIIRIWPWAATGYSTTGGSTSYNSEFVLLLWTIALDYISATNCSKFWVRAMCRVLPHIKRV